MRSDADELVDKLKPQAEEGGGGRGGGGGEGGAVGGAANDPLALCLSFTLSKSSYATVCLRELTKQVCLGGEGEGSGGWWQECGWVCFWWEGVKMATTTTSSGVGVVVGAQLH